MSRNLPTGAQKRGFESFCAQTHNEAAGPAMRTTRLIKRLFLSKKNLQKPEVLQSFVRKDA